MTEEMISPEMETLETPESPEADRAALAEVPDDWPDWLNKVPASSLRRHPKLAGWVGGEAQKLARRQADDLRKQLATEFEGKMNEARQAWDAEARKPHRDELAKRLGSALGQTEEWQTATPEERMAIIEKLAKLSDDDAIPTFLQESARFLSKKQTARAVKEYVEKRLKAEREAIKQELAAQFMQAIPAPDTRRPSGLPARFDVWGMSDEQFDDYWDKHIRG